MTDFARTLTVEFVEPGFGEAPRTHAILADLAGEGREVLHLWTSDPELAARLVPGAQVEVSTVGCERRCGTCRWHGALGFNDSHPWHETARLCERPDLRAVGEPDPVGRIVTLPDFSCVQWEAMSSRG